MGNELLATVTRNRKKVSIRNIILPIIMMIGNAFAILLGMIYISVGYESNAWNIYGIYLLIIFLCNISKAALQKREKGYAYTYLLFSFLAMLIIPFFNTVVSSLPTHEKSQSVISAALLLYLLLFGGIMAALNITDSQSESLSLLGIKYNVKYHKLSIANLAIVVFSGILYIGFFITINIFRKHKFLLLEAYVAQYALFYGIAFISLGILIIKLLEPKRYHIYKIIVFLITFSIFAMSFTPVISIPGLIKKANLTYTKAFGVNSIPKNQEINFRGVPFSIPDYFFGVSSNNYHLIEDILFFEGTTGIDKGIKLYFDVYLPKLDASKLPGNYSVLIRIHGGGWITGDKGVRNNAQINKYFASQGYIVFDIQYGLNDLFDISDMVPKVNKRLGDFSINDMVRHIGIFTKYLAENKEDYKANTKSVFLSGGSAGGQLALAAGLGIASDKYENYFDESIQIKGLIPFYPANGLSYIFNISGKREFLDPSELVETNSPPCLIFQGSHDGFVDLEVANRLVNAYINRDNGKCALITMPFGGHGSDLYFSGYYSQIFLYYMERFMYRYQ